MKIIIDNGMESEREIPFSHIVSNSETMTSTFSTENMEDVDDVDLIGLNDLHFHSISAVNETGAEIPLAGTYNHVSNVSISYSAHVLTLQVFFNAVGGIS